MSIMYSFSGGKSRELSEKYDADREGDIMRLCWDTTPDQEMLEEGVAREVINRVQKLRTSADPPSAVIGSSSGGLLLTLSGSLTLAACSSD